jgi:hypothetical protein
MVSRACDVSDFPKVYGMLCLRVNSQWKYDVILTSSNICQTMRKCHYLREFCFLSHTLNHIRFLVSPSYRAIAWELRSQFFPRELVYTVLKQPPSIYCQQLLVLLPL